MKKALFAAAIISISLTGCFEGQSYNSCDGIRANPNTPPALTIGEQSAAPTGAQPVLMTTIDNTVDAIELTLTITGENFRGNTNTLIAARGLRFSLFKQALACSPLPLQLIGRVNGFSITSNTDFNANYPAGSDLSPLFEVVYFGNIDGSNSAPAEELDFWPKEFTRESLIQLRLTEAPAEAGEYAFVISATPESWAWSTSFTVTFAEPQ